MYLRFDSRVSSQPHDFLRITQLLESVKGSPYRIEWIPAAQRFRDDIVSTRQLNDCPNSASCNDPRSIRGGLQKDMFRPK